MSMNKTKASVVFSGGPDSTAAAMWAVSHDYDVTLLTIITDINAQSGELRSSMNVARKLGLPQKFISFEGPLRAFPGELRPFVHAGTSTKNVPGQAYLMPFGATALLSLCASWTIDRGASVLVWGATKDDQITSPEYSQAYADKLADLAVEATSRPLKIVVPFSSKRKPEVLLAYKTRTGVFEATWSCKRPIDAEQCGECAACRARRLSAQVARIQDVTGYVGGDFSLTLSGVALPADPELRDADWDILAPILLANSVP